MRWQTGMACSRVLTTAYIIRMSYTLLLHTGLHQGYGQSVYAAPDASLCDATDSSWQHKACHGAATFFWSSLMVA